MSRGASCRSVPWTAARCASLSSPYMALHSAHSNESTSRSYQCRRVFGVCEELCGSEGRPCDHLRKMMLEELQRRNYAQSTVNGYLRVFRSSPSIFTKRRTGLVRIALAGSRLICSYKGSSTRERCSRYVAALRFFSSCRTSTFASPDDDEPASYPLNAAA
jgi:hypothetical protein